MCRIAGLAFIIIFIALALIIQYNKLKYGRYKVVQPEESNDHFLF